MLVVPERKRSFAQAELDVLLLSRLQRNLVEGTQFLVRTHYGAGLVPDIQLDDFLPRSFASVLDAHADRQLLVFVDLTAIDPEL